jgi:hypothetical protein
MGLIIHSQERPALALPPSDGVESLAATVRQVSQGTFMNLSAPTFPVFIISLVLAILAVLVAYAGIKIPVISGNAFLTLLLGYVVLLAGNLLKGI